MLSFLYHLTIFPALTTTGILGCYVPVAFTEWPCHIVSLVGDEAWGSGTAHSLVIWALIDQRDIVAVWQEPRPTIKAIGIAKAARKLGGMREYKFSTLTLIWKVSTKYPTIASKMRFFRARYFSCPEQCLFLTFTEYLYLSNRWYNVHFYKSKIFPISFKIF